MSKNLHSSKETTKAAIKNCMKFQDGKKSIQGMPLHWFYNEMWNHGFDLKKAEEPRPTSRHTLDDE